MVAPLTEDVLGFQSSSESEESDSDSEGGTSMDIHGPNLNKEKVNETVKEDGLNTDEMSSKDSPSVSVSEDGQALSTNKSKESSVENQEDHKVKQ